MLSRAARRENIEAGGPMERIKYQKPSRINLVSVLLLLCLLAAGYALYQFGPPYYRRWKATTVLSETVNKIYPKRGATGQTESELYDGLRKEVEQKLRDLGIPSELKIEFRKDKVEIAGTLEYTETVNHWFVNKSTVLRFYLQHSMSATSSLQ
jgi:hypothetical protein